MGDIVRGLCFAWLMKAFRAGQGCPRFSDQASEYYAPLIELEWSKQMVDELKAAQPATPAEAKPEKVDP